MQKKILIIDDSAFMRKVIRLALKNEEYVIIEGKSGFEALELYQLHRPDIVSLDITMEGMDGFRTLSELLAIDEKANVVICSSMVHKNIKQEALHLGAKAFIRKPFQNEEYTSVVKGLF